MSRNFAAYGLLQVIITDNGRTSVSSEFQQFLRMNGIKHKRTSLFNPATNGQVEFFWERKMKVWYGVGKKRKIPLYNKIRRWSLLKKTR